MDKIKKVINSSLFQAATAGVVGALLIIQGHPLYGGVAVGVGLTKFIAAFKSTS